MIPHAPKACVHPWALTELASNLGKVPTGANRDFAIELADDDTKLAKLANNRGACVPT